MVAEENKKLFYQKIYEYLNDHQEIIFDQADSFLKSLCLQKRQQLSIAQLEFVEQLYEREKFVEVLSFATSCIERSETKFKGDLYKYAFYSSKKIGEVFNAHLIFESMVSYYISIRNVMPVLEDIEEYSKTFPFEFPLLLRRLEAYLSLERSDKVEESFVQIKNLVENNLAKLRGFTRDREKLYKRMLEVFFKYNTTNEFINKAQLELTLAIVKERLRKNIAPKNLDLVISTLVEFIVLATKSNDYAITIVLLDSLVTSVDKTELIKMMKKCEDYDYLKIVNQNRELRNILTPKKKILKEASSKSGKERTIEDDSVQGPIKNRDVQIEESNLLERKDILKNDLLMENLIRKKILCEVTGIEKDLVSVFRDMGLNRSLRALESGNSENK